MSLDKTLCSSCIDTLCVAYPFLTGATPKPIKLSENHTFCFTSPEGKLWILRITPDDHRNSEEIKAELTFMSILTRENSNLNICDAIRNEHGDLFVSVTPYEDGKKWWAAVFNFAKGSSDGFDVLANYEAVEEWGRCTGRMHKISSKYGCDSANTDSEEWKQILSAVPNWDQTHFGALSPSRIEELGKLSDKGAEVAADWKGLLERLNSIPKTSNSFGVVHGDLNLSNFFVEKGEQLRLWLFDFDQIQTNYFGCDIAVAITGARFLYKFGWAGKPLNFDISKYEESFLRGYESEYQKVDRDELDIFVDWRELYNTSISLDILDKIANNKEEFDESISSFVKLLVDRYPSRNHKGIRD